MECVFGEYLKFVENFLLNYYRILLGNRYEKKLVKPLIDKYISVRYHNDSISKNRVFVQKLNKELNSIAVELMQENDDKIDKIKNIFALFSYILYIDGCIRYADLNSLLKTLFNDSNITLEYTDEAKRDLGILVREYDEKKLDFFKQFNIKDFCLEEKRYSDNVIMVDLKQNYSVSKLYSDMAIEKAYNSEVVFENRVYLSLLILNYKVLSEVINLNFKKNYIIKLPATLFKKQKKMARFLNSIDDDLLKSKIHLKFTYKEYKENKKEVSSIINQGFSVCLELDETYNTNFDDLFLFSYILVNKKYDYYGIIINSKEDVKTNIITL